MGKVISSVTSDPVSYIGETINALEASQSDDYSKSDDRILAIFFCRPT